MPAAVTATRTMPAAATPSQPIPAAATPSLKPAAATASHAAAAPGEEVRTQKRKVRAITG